MSDKLQSRAYEPINAQPVKRFFVEMLTRDIALEDAILDLLDNCLDGVLRTLTTRAGDPAQSADSPYDGYWAKLTVGANSFVIEDNCGGIPWSEHERAFRMGRPAESDINPRVDPALSVGTYGIGMKRAIFRMGSKALIESQNNTDSYSIPISPEWMKSESDWSLEVIPSETQMAQDGTRICVELLHPGVSERFAADSFENDLLDRIQSQYAVILRKGLRVEVNGVAAVPKPILFKFAHESDTGSPIHPYMFRTQHEGVEVFLAVGLRQPIPGAEDVLEEQRGKQFSSEYAGWTVICNDRVVVYCNRDELTGWGTAGVPRYHTQFIALSGVVEFRGDARRLPTTTTKRGLDFSSPLYQQVLDRMREGTRLFIDYTNHWKTRQEEAKAQVEPVQVLTYPEVKHRATSVHFSPTRSGLPGEQYKPRLPIPPRDSPDSRISYFKSKVEIARLGEKLVEDSYDLSEPALARKVGEASFEFSYRELIGRNGAR